MSARNFESLKCIWMSSGVVDYRLCHLDFDCDNCEFDKAIRNTAGSPKEMREAAANIFDDQKEKAAADEYGADTVCLSSHYILRRVFQNSHLITFPFFIWRWMEPVSDLTCSVERGLRRRGETLFRLRGTWGEFEAPAPFDLYMHSSFVEEKNAPFFGSWLGLLETDDAGIAAQQMSITQSRETALAQLDKLAREFSVHPRMLQDGGAALPYLHQVIGKKRLTALLGSLIRVF